MTLKAAKGAWQVTAGVLPGTAEERLTKVWHYSSDDLEEDRKTAEVNAKHSAQPHLQVDTKFMEMRDAAHNYAKEITDPRQVNWVKVDFIWY